MEETRKELPLPNNGESLKFFLKKKDLMINMAIMTLVWISVLYNYTLIQFMLTTFKREYLASCFSAIADIIGYLLGAWFYYKMGLKQSLGGSFLVSVCGGLLITAIGLKHEGSWLFPVLVIIAKTGVSVSYQIIYVAHPSLFPVLFAATALGWVQFIGNVVSLGAVSQAEGVSKPMSLLTFTFFSAVAGVSLLGLRKGTGSVQDKH